MSGDYEPLVGASDIKEGEEHKPGSQRRTAVIVVAAVAIIFLLLFLWRSWLNAAPPPAAPPPTAVVATVVQPSEVPVALEAVGSLRAVREVTLAPEVAGRVTAIGFNGGERVGAGAALVWPAGFYQVDAWVIPAKSAHPDLALNWISFAAQPENQVQLPAQIRSGVTHLAAIEQVQPGLARDTPTARDTLPRLLPADQDFWQENGARLEAGFKAWRAGHTP